MKKRNIKKKEDNKRKKKKEKLDNFIDNDKEHLTKYEKKRKSYV